MIKFRNNSYISDEQFNNIIVESKRQTQGLFSSIIENIEDVQFDNCINEAILDINQILNHVNDLMQLNRKDELLDNLNRYFDNCTEGKVDYEVDKLGLMSNSLSGADRERQLIVVKEYFTFCLYRLFYLELIPKIVKALPPQQQPKTDYWQDDAEEITLIAEYQKAVNKLVEGGDTGCFPMRFRMLPRVVLNENKYSLQRKKYLLKQMRLVLDEVKNTEIGRELFTDLYERIEPYADIFRFVFSETPLPPQQNDKPKPELKLNDFFIKEVSSDTIAAIQTEFRELEGKDLAILIYLLHKEHKIIEILTNSRTKGRKGFVKCLKETDNPKMQKVNKCFVPNTDDLIYSKDDLVFQSLNKRLTETIKI